MATTKGMKCFHRFDPEEERFFHEEPGSPWIQGRHPKHRKPRRPESNEKARQTMRKRLAEFGPSEAELAGYQQLSRTRVERKIGVDGKTRRKIAETLTGQRLGWQEGRSKANAVKWGCDVAYILKLTTKDGVVFGKWGSSKESSFIHREKEFRRHGFTFEVIVFEWFGAALAPEIEAMWGRKLSQFPTPVSKMEFIGKTECFEWCEATQKIIEEIIHGMEENPPS
jgi:hypothetical protein